jgi:predicted Rossmann fold flavoprotein
MCRMTKEIWDVAVIGGGPSGMMAAGQAALMGKSAKTGQSDKSGAKVILIEKNPELGRKLLITGGGRCNVTNAEFDNRKLLENFKENGKFLFSAFSQWSVRDTLDFFNSRGMATKVENENRVFPASNSSKSVLDTLLIFMKEGGVKVLANSPIKELKCEDKLIISAVLENGEEIFARKFVVATGGKSYPKTGSTGDGFVWLKKLGHNIIKSDSALVPVNIRESWVKSLQGVTLPEVKISIFQENARIESKKGKILFTHFGVSGPTVLNMSRKINELLPYGDVYLSLDLMPTHDFSTLNEELQQLFKDRSNKMIKNSLSDLIASAMVPVVLQMSDISEETFNNSVTREQRIKLMHVLKDLRMQVSSLLSPENAIVSSGGVDLTEVDFRTMQSKLVPNLYLTGDILNINRPSGGFSLQLCWTTGTVAGRATMAKAATKEVADTPEENTSKTRE